MVDNPIPKPIAQPGANPQGKVTITEHLKEAGMFEVVRRIYKLFHGQAIMLISGGENNAKAKKRIKRGIDGEMPGVRPNVPKVPGRPVFLF